MIFDKMPRRKIVRSWSGPGTCETIYQDERGNTYRDVSAAEADMIRGSTAGIVYWRHPDGTIS